VLKYLELAHLHKGEVIGVEQVQRRVTRLWVSVGPDPEGMSLVPNPRSRLAVVARPNSAQAQRPNAG
jgi:hypothetical protein